jgi:hypothetical protein
VRTTSIYSEWTRWDCDAVLEEELSRDTEAVPPAHKSESSSLASASSSLSSSRPTKDISWVDNISSSPQKGKVSDRQEGSGEAAVMEMDGVYASDAGAISLHASVIIRAYIRPC